MLFHRLTALEEQAKSIGLRWDHISEIVAQIQSEAQEVLEELPSGEHLKEELGDLLHAIICCPLFLGIDLTHELETYVETLDRSGKCSVCLHPRAFMEMVQQIIDQTSHLQGRLVKAPSCKDCRDRVIHMLHIGCQVVHQSGFLCRDVIEGSMKKIKTRLDKVVLLAYAKGIDQLLDLSLEEKLVLWEEVKSMEKNAKLADQYNQ